MACDKTRGTKRVTPEFSAAAGAPESRPAGLYAPLPYPVVLAAGIAGRVRVDFFDSDLDNLW